MNLPFKDINAYERLGACRFLTKKNINYSRLGYFKPKTV